MKKLSGLLFTMSLVLMLTGCGSETQKEKKDVIASKTCEFKMEDGIKQTWKYTATNGKIDLIDLLMVYDNSLFEVESLADLKDKEKEKIKSSMLETLGLESTTYEGLTIDINIEEEMSVKIHADLKKADPENLKKVGLDFTDVEDMSLEGAVKDMTEGGATCK